MRSATEEHTFAPSRVGLHAGVLCGVAETPDDLVAGEHAAVQRLAMGGGVIVTHPCIFSIKKKNTKGIYRVANE